MLGRTLGPKPQKTTKKLIVEAQRLGKPVGFLLLTGQPFYQIGGDDRRLVVRQISACTSGAAVVDLE